MDVQLSRMLTLVLAAACGVLLLAALVQLAGYGKGYGWLPAGDTQGQAIDAAIDRRPFSLPAQASFSEIEARPLFNDDRKPTPVEVASAEPDQPKVPLNVTLTGVLIVRKTTTTPELRIAMVRDNARNETLALKVGMPLAGDQSGWTLASLQPRMAVFKNASDETSEVELQTAANAPGPAVNTRPGAPAKPPVPPAAPGAVAPEKKENASDSDLAKRIEERRRQMREEADRLRKERGGDQANEQKQ
jgi:general secretion pathway protein N